MMRRRLEMGLYHICDAVYEWFGISIRKGRHVVSGTLLCRDLEALRRNTHGNHLAFSI